MTARADAVYYSYIFDLGADLDVPHVAKRLLKEEVAEVAAAPSSSVPRLSPRFRELHHLKAKAEKMEELADRVEAGEFSHRLWLRYATKAYITVVLPAVARTYLRALVRRQGLGLSSAHSSDDNSTDPSVREHSGGRTYRDIADSMRSTASFIEKAVRAAEVDGGFRNAMDRVIYSPGYLDDDPYIRLLLRRAQIRFDHEDASRSAAQNTSTTVNGDDDGWVDVGASLQIYASGTCVLTLDILLDLNTDTAGLSSFTHSASPLIRTSKLAAPILQAASSSTGWKMQGEWTEEVREGTRWRRVEHPDPVSVRDLFSLYREAIQHVSARDLTNDWLGYTTLFMTGTCCRGRAEAHAEHLHELARLAGRYPLSADLDANHAHSLLRSPLGFNSEEIWVGPGNATHASWQERPATINPANHHLSLGPLQHAVANAYQLHTLDRNTRSARLTTKDVRQAQDRLLLGLDNFNPRLIVTKEGQAVAERIYSQWDTPSLHQRLNDRVSLLGDVLNQRRADKAASRSVGLSLLSLLAALVVGIPAIYASLGLLLDDASWLAAPVGAAAAHAGGLLPLALAVYVVLVALTVLTVALMVATGRIVGLGKLRQRRAVGIEWPGTGLSVFAAPSRPARGGHPVQNARDLAKD